jgi:hypothetical protein
MNTNWIIRKKQDLDSTIRLMDAGKLMDIGLADHLIITKDSYLVPHTKKDHITVILTVVWGGIEPPTQGFSVLCSTN